MNRRYLVGAFAVILTAVVATTIVRCDFPLIAFTGFSYIPHERPRVFVSHHPLRALPGAKVTIRLTPDLRVEDGAVLSAKAGLRRLDQHDPRARAGRYREDDRRDVSRRAYACAGRALTATPWPRHGAPAMRPRSMRPRTSAEPPHLRAPCSNSSAKSRGIGDSEL